MQDKDHAEIWLQHPSDANEYDGRQWCQDRVWPDQPEDGEPTRYVRADLFEAQAAENARLREALGSPPIISKYHGMSGFEYNRFMDDYASWRDQARAALASDTDETEE